MVIPSKGAKRFADVVENAESIEHVAVALGVSSVTVRNIMSGTYPPNLHSALVIKRLYKIPVESWEEYDDERKLAAK